MEIKEFCLAVKVELVKYLGHEVTVKVETIAKNNGIFLNSIIIGEEGKNISPTIYIDEMYKEHEAGTSLTQICKRILHIYESSRNVEPIDISLFTDYSRMQKRLAYRLIHLEKNKELLLNVPYIPFYDLAIVFYYLFEEEACGTKNNCSILIYNHHMKMWGITKKELLKTALKNTPLILPPVLRTLQQVIIDICKEDVIRELERQGGEAEKKADSQWLEAEAKKLAQPMLLTEEELPLYVLGNEKKLFGAAAMLYRDSIKEVAAKLDSNIFILPCSVHELIIIPDDGSKNSVQMKLMVSDVNETQLDPEEVLSDSIYYYNAETGKISLIC